MWLVVAGISWLLSASPIAVQVSLYHMDFKPAYFNPASPGLAAGEMNVGPTNFAMPGFGWDVSHGQQVAWYVSTTPMAMPTSSAALFDLPSLAYNPAAGNSNNLTIDPTNAVAPVVGGPAGSLAGLFIKGVGVLHSVTSPSGDFSSWNYAG
jgi:hypothetical protein